MRHSVRPNIRQPFFDGVGGPNRMLEIRAIRGQIVSLSSRRIGDFVLEVSVLGRTRLKSAFDHPKFIFELKQDGFRSIAFLDGSGCLLIWRKGHIYRGLRSTGPMRWPSLPGPWCWMVRLSLSTLTDAPSFKICCTIAASLFFMRSIAFRSTAETCVASPWRNASGF
jgi:hypothetical protein